MNEKQGTWVEVSKDAIRHNISVLRGLVSRGTKICSVVKANAYGHGLLGTAKILDSVVDMLAVFTKDDALQLRKANIRSPILVLGATSLEDIAWLSKHRFPVHIKVDTGLSRLGVHVDQLSAFIKKIPPKIKIEGIYSHFADAENLRDRDFTLRQIQEFKRAISIMSDHGIAPLTTHIAATDGILRYPEAEFDMVRVGIATYGVPPSRDFENKFSHLGLEPALSWKTHVVELKTIPKGATVGYGRTFTASRAMQVAVLPVGYWDGYPRALSGKTVLGRVTMNMIMIEGEGLQIGDEVELIGKKVSALDLAENAGTISYEIITRINPWIPRKYV